jgi:hypothetical protein
MGANRGSTSKEFEEMLEILKSTRMAVSAPFAAFIDRDGDGSGEQVGFACSRHTVCDRAEE